MTTLLEYQTTNYTRCSPNQSIIDSPDFLSISAKIESLIIIPVNLFGIYCILCQSPKYMKTFQWHLLHLHCWFLTLSTCYTLLTTPFHFYPAIVRCSVGFLRYLVSSASQLYLIYGVYGGVVCSVILLFEHRHSQLVPDSESFYRLRLPHRVLLGVLNFAFGSSNALVLVVEPADQERLKLAALQLVPCPHPLFFEPCAVAIGSRSDVYRVMVDVACLLPLLQFVFFVSHSAVYLKKSQSVDTFSVRTKRIQKAFFRAAVAQVAAPVGVLVAPMLVLAYVFGTGNYVQGVINISILLIPCLSVISTASLIIFNAPYRKFVRSLLGVRWQEDTRIRVTMVSSF